MAIKPFKNKIWLSSPTMHGGELRYVTEAYESNWMSTIGSNINAIEEQIAELTGTQYAVALSSGTSAIHLALKLAGVKPGERVFCSDLTFSASANPIVYEGGVPVFIDSERDTWNMDPVALEKAFELYPEVRIIVLVHLYGTPVKIDEIVRIATEHDAIIIEDAAESLGATYKGKQTGSFGTYNCISFNGNKIITGSSGGMLLTDYKDAAAQARKWSTQAREIAPWYQHEELGYNYRMSNVVAGVVRGQLPHLEKHIASKKAIFQRYKQGFRDLPISMNPFEEDKAEPNYWLSCMLIDEVAMSQQQRGEFDYSYESIPGKSCPHEVLDALKAINAEGRPIWKPMHMQPIFKNNAFVSCKEGSASEEIFRRGVCLPSDIKMTEKEQNAVIRCIANCFN